MINRRRSGTILAACVAITAGCWSMGSGKSSASGAPAAEPAATPKPTSSPTLQNKMPDNIARGGFVENLPAGFEQPSDDAGRLLLREYGAVFVARGGAVPPKKVVFRDEQDVAAFQASLRTASETVGGTRIELQAPAMDALKAAVAEAKAQGMTIGPRGADSARRGYTQTVTLWASRVDPGLAFWTGKGRITAVDSARIKRLSPFEQVPEILRLERDGIYFAKTLDKSIIYSVAPPGTSQHLSMLALDVKEFDDPRVRAILARHGWYQTVASDLPHFTFLGVDQAGLPALGLKQIQNSGRSFWVPDI